MTATSSYRRMYLRGHYRRGGSVPWPVLAGAAAALLVSPAAAAAVTHHHHHAAAPAAPAPAPAVAAGYTPQTWAPAFLAFAHLPLTRCNRAAVVAWIRAEGSNWAWRNPLDTTQTEPGSSPINSVNVQAFTTWRAGLIASAVTIHNGRYPGVLAAFQAGNNAQTVADAVAASPWGTQPFSAEC